MPRRRDFVWNEVSSISAKQSMSVLTNRRDTLIRDHATAGRRPVATADPLRVAELQCDQIETMKGTRTDAHSLARNLSFHRPDFSRKVTRLWGKCQFSIISMGRMLCSSSHSHIFTPPDVSTDRTRSVASLCPPKQGPHVIPVETLL